MGENIVWSRLVHLKIYKSRYPMMGICFFFANFASRKSEWWIFQGYSLTLNGGYFKVKEY